MPDKQLQKWLLYGIRAMFWLSVLTLTVSLATKVTDAVAAGFMGTSNNLKKLDLSIYNLFTYLACDSRD